MELTGNLATGFAIGSLVLTALCLLFVVANPYRVRRVSQEQLANFLPEKRQEQILALGDAWAGRVKISQFQIAILSYGGFVLGAGLSWFLRPLLGLVYTLLVMIILGGLLWYLPRQRFEGGFPKNVMDKLEREAPIFSAFMHRAIGITGLSVQMSFEQFLEVYPEKETSKLLGRIPEGIAYPDAVLSLGLPVTKIPNWIQVIQTVSSVGDFGDPEIILKDVRDRIRKREEQYLRMMIKRKAFAAPAATVIIMLPGLMCVLLGSILLQAVRTLGGGGF